MSKKQLNKYGYYRQYSDDAPMTEDEQAEAAGWVFSQKRHPVINKTYATFTLPDGRKRVRFEDGIFYNADEVSRINRGGGITNEIHNIKKIFKGIVL